MVMTIKIIAVALRSIMVILWGIFANFLTRRPSMYDRKHEAMLRIHESLIHYTNKEQNSDVHLHKSVQMGMIVFRKNQSVYSKNITRLLRRLHID